MEFRREPDFWHKILPSSTQGLPRGLFAVAVDGRRPIPLHSAVPKRVSFTFSCAFNHVQFDSLFFSGFSSDVILFPGPDVVLPDVREFAIAATEEGHQQQQR